MWLWMLTRWLVMVQKAVLITIDGNTRSVGFAVIAVVQSMVMRTLTLTVRASAS